MARRKESKHILHEEPKGMVNSFWDPGIWKCDRVNRRHMEKGNRKNESGKLHKWPQSCSVRFIKVHGKLQLTPCLPKVMANLPQGEAAILTIYLGRQVPEKLEVGDKQIFHNFWYILGFWLNTLLACLFGILKLSRNTYVYTDSDAECWVCQVRCTPALCILQRMWGIGQWTSLWKVRKRKGNLDTS